MNLLMLVVLFGVGAGLEIIMFSLPVWKVRYLRLALCVACITLLSVSLGFGLFLQPLGVLLVLATIQLYRLVNLYRIAEQRMNDYYMLRTTRRTSLWLIAAQFMVIGGAYGVSSLAVANSTLVTVLVIGQVLAAGLLLLTAHVRLRTSAYQTVERAQTVPTVTVAIPARNETQDLEQCLQSLVRTNYPKLEILVLDDCSQLRRTPEIIRSFAQAGVRFVKGDEIREHWLAKNQAYDSLLDHANGDIVMFCGVDTRFESHTLQTLVDQLVGSEKKMISIMPLRTDAKKPTLVHAQANRYIREFLLPAFMLKRPPVLSSCWLIYKKDILKLGGMDAVRHAVTPEGYFANLLAKRNAYKFTRSDTSVGLTSMKSPQAQSRTAIRTLYPQLQRRPELVLLTLAYYTAVVYGPIVVLLLSLRHDVPLVYGAVSLLSLAMMLAAYLRIARTTNIQALYTAVLYAPFAAVIDLVLLHISMIKYEFSEVIWKGRNVCEPVMHVLPSLPKA